MNPSPCKRWRWIGLSVLAVAGLAWWFLPNVPRPRILEHWPAADSGWEPWQPVFQGVEYTRANFSQPRPLKAHAIRVDLAAPGIEVVVNQPTDPGGSTFAATYATEHLKRFKFQVVVSGGPFRPTARWAGKRVDPIGIAISDGIKWSEAVPNLHALIITPDHRVRLTTDQSDTNNAWQELAGNWIILRGGTNQMEHLAIETSSVAGHSPDGRLLYWLIVDGHQPGWSEGATPVETAELLLSLGASDGIRLDEGSVVTLAMERGRGGARLINRPSHPYITGVQRPIGSFVGIRARPLGTNFSKSLPANRVQPFRSSGTSMPVAIRVESGAR